MNWLDRYILQKHLSQKYYKVNMTPESELDNWILSRLRMEANITNSIISAEIEKQIAEAAEKTITKEIEKIFK